LKGVNDGEETSTSKLFGESETMKEREPRGKGVGKWMRRLQSGRGEMQRRLDIESLRRRGDRGREKCRRRRGDVGIVESSTLAKKRERQ